MKSYLAAGDIELTEADVAAIDAAGIIGGKRVPARTILRYVAIVGLIFMVGRYIGLHTL